MLFPLSSVGQTLPDSPQNTVPIYHSISPMGTGKSKAINDSGNQTPLLSRSFSALHHFSQFEKIFSVLPALLSRREYSPGSLRKGFFSNFF
jgi:hypothetical protein